MFGERLLLYQKYFRKELETSGSFGEVFHYIKSTVVTNNIENLFKALSFLKNLLIGNSILAIPRIFHETVFVMFKGVIHIYLQKKLTLTILYLSM